MLGKASLAESFVLKAPQTPTRSSFKDSANLLRFHGFDGGFDKRLTRAADAIVAEETPLDRLLEPALQKFRARWDFARLRCASVRITKKLAETEKQQPAAAAPGAAADAKAAAAAAALVEARARVAELLAQASATCGVEAKDITVSVEDGFLCCNMLLQSANASLPAVVEALSSALHDKRGFPELHETLAEAGAAPEGQVAVVPQWPMARVRELVRLAYPQYDLPLEKLDKRLTPILAASWKAYREAWQRAMAESPTHAESLLAQESFDAPRGGPPARHGAEDLKDIMADAAQAHRMLKETFGEGSTWSRLSMNDTERIISESERRSWLSCSSDLAPNAVHYDPGLRDEHAVFQEAKRRQRAYEAAPVLSEIIDVSRLVLTFATLGDVWQGVSQILSRLDVVKLENRFRNPSCMGHRDMLIAVRQQLMVQDPTNSVIRRAHISAIEVRLKEMHEVHLSDGRLRLGEIRSFVASCGVLPQHIDRVLELVLQGLSYTNGTARSEALGELIRGTTFYSLHARELGLAGSQLAEQLADELGEQALAAGASEASVEQAVAVVPSLNQKRALRKRRIRLRDEMAAQLSQYAGVSFEELLRGMLEDLRSLPTDDDGRVCLRRKWWELPRFAGCPAAWRSISAEGRLQLHEFCIRMQQTAQAINAEELQLLGCATELQAELGALHHKCAADQLGQALVRFLLARGLGQRPTADEVVEASSWAASVSSVSPRTLEKVSSFLQWTAFEDQLCRAFTVPASEHLLEALREALSSKDAEHADCAEFWQTSGLPSLCARLSKRDQKVLPLAIVLLSCGKAEVRSQLAETLAVAEGNDTAPWLMRLVSGGVVPILATMLGSRVRSCVTAAAHALKTLSTCVETRPNVSEAGLIPTLSTLVLDRSAGEEGSFYALAVLNHLAKVNEANVAAIRAAGLNVDALNRVSKKR